MSRKEAMNGSRVRGFTGVILRRKPEGLRDEKGGSYWKLNLFLGLLLAAIVIGVPLLNKSAKVVQPRPQEVQPLPVQEDLSPKPPSPPPAEEPLPSEPPPFSGANRLKVVAFRPTNRTFNYPDDVIEVEFSMPMDQEATEAAFSISPPVAGTFSWPTPTKLVFTPSRLLDLESRYLVTLSDQARDSSGFHRLAPTSFSFATVGGYFYTRDIKPLLEASCSSCHNPQGPAGRVNLDTYAQVKRYIEVGNAEGSPLYTALKDDVHRSGLDQKALAKAYLIRDWINKNQAGD